MANAAEDTQFELDVGDAEETEVELESPQEEETPTEEVVDTTAQENTAPSSDDEEMEQYSESVKKRINRLTKKMREAERERDESISYAQKVQAEAEQIRQRMQNLDQGFMAEHGQRLDLQREQAEAALKRAVELGDAEGTVAAQKALTDVTIASNNYAQAQRQAQPLSQPQAQAAPQPQAQPQAQAAPQRPDPKAEQWAEKNTWFGSDEAMTFAAFGIHKKLIEDEGFDPQSDEYYTELDRRMQGEFPHKLNGGSRRPAQTVASVSRSSGRSSGKKVRLTPSQVAIAKKLGVPLEEYAKYVKE